jgi:S-methylmethionine-dependent homocysteine/selenocysteine methylase
MAHDSNDISLPHSSPEVLYLTDSGLETTLIFKDHIDLREFAAFELLNDEKGREHIKAYYRRHAALSAPRDGEQPLGFVFEGVTWRANADWMKKLGYGPEDLQEICNKSIKVMAEVREEFPHLAKHGILSGNLGPRSDGYVANLVMTPQEAMAYHLPQVQALKSAGANMIMVATLNYIDEGIGIAHAAKEVGIPCVLSFTVETDGCLRTGESIRKIVETIDEVTNNGPAYYMINCAHPTHFLPALSDMKGEGGNSVGEDGSAGEARAWVLRIGGVRGNASKLSHAELDDAEKLDDGNPEEFGRDYLDVLDALPNANVLGGCCGKDGSGCYIFYAFLSCLKVQPILTVRNHIAAWKPCSNCMTGTDVRHVERIRSVCSAAFRRRSQRARQ